MKLSCSEFRGTRRHCTERLLDHYLGEGNEKRTAELAAELEQIHTERGNTAAAERFADLRQRFDRAALITEAAVFPPAAQEPRAGSRSQPRPLKTETNQSLAESEDVAEAAETAAQNGLAEKEPSRIPPFMS